MTTHRLDTAKLVAAVDRRRGAGKPGEVSYRQLGRELGIAPSAFSRLNAGLPPRTDALCSLLMWLDPQARVADFVAPADAPRPARHARQLEPVMPGR